MRGAVKREVAATDEYDRLVQRAYRADVSCAPKAAAKLAKQAIELDPDRPGAYFVLGNACRSSEEFLRARECFLSAMHGALSAGAC